MALTRRAALPMLEDSTDTLARATRLDAALTIPNVGRVSPLPVIAT